MENNVVVDDGLSGLSLTEVNDRVGRGLVNINTNVKTKSISEIVTSHLLTLFNIVNLGLAALVLTTGQWRNLMFLLVVFVNLLVGIYQEIRSKIAIDRLSILTTSQVEVIRDSKHILIPVDELVLDDLICLKHGDQIPADSVVLSGRARVNESLITGESNPIVKTESSELLSGSYLEMGSLVARVVAVGSDCYAAKINNEAKYVKTPVSEIISTTKGIIKFATIALVPIGVCLFVRSYADSGDYNQAVLSCVAAVISMIPQGLVLLTNSVMTIAATRLAKQKVLVQQMYCIETLARVDTLCLDKTGTITTGAMRVIDTVSLTDSKTNLNTALASISMSQQNDANQTALALIKYIKANSLKSQKVVRCIPFDSARKYSGVELDDGSKYVMGATTFICDNISSDMKDVMSTFKPYERVLLVARVDDFDDEGGIVGDVSPMGFVKLMDEIRPSAKDTISFFKKQGVDVVVISGDDPSTVSAIASSVDISNADKYVDATNLTSYEDICDAIDKYCVFGRVTPVQKRMLVDALKDNGKCVAMTGDGVNDILALREADASISFVSGSEAARNISEIVLANDDFSCLPDVVYEGRRSINNLQRSASLFLVKTVYAIVLALVCIFSPPYPFIPIQMSLLSGLVIGLPSFVLALEPNHERVDGNYLVNVLTRSLPASATIVILLVSTLISAVFTGWSFEEISTICTALTAVVGVALIFRLSQPFTLLRRILLFIVILFLLGGFFVFGQFFKIADLSWNTWYYIYLQTALGLCIFNFLLDVALEHIDDSNKFYRFICKTLGTSEKRKPSL